MDHIEAGIHPRLLMALELRGRIFGENGDITVHCDALGVDLAQYGDSVEEAYRDAVVHLKLILKAHRFLAHLLDSSLADGPLAVHFRVTCRFAGDDIELSTVFEVLSFGDLNHADKEAAKGNLIMGDAT